MDDAVRMLPMLEELNLALYGKYEPSEVVVLLYVVLLNRPPDKAAQSWVSHLEGGMPRTEVASHLLTSSEGKQVDPQQRQAAFHFLTARSAYTREGVAERLLSLDEIFSREWFLVSQLYLAVLSREPSSFELTEGFQALETQKGALGVYRLAWSKRRKPKGLLAGPRHALAWLFHRRRANSQVLAIERDSSLAFLSWRQAMNLNLVPLRQPLLPQHLDPDVAE